MKIAVEVVICSDYIGTFTKVIDTFDNVEEAFERKNEVIKMDLDEICTIYGGIDMDHTGIIWTYVYTNIIEL